MLSLTCPKMAAVNTINFLIWPAVSLEIVGFCVALRVLNNFFPNSWFINLNHHSDHRLITDVVSSLNSSQSLSLAVSLYLSEQIPLLGKEIWVLTSQPLLGVDLKCEREPKGVVLRKQYNCQFTQMTHRHTVELNCEHTHIHIHIHGPSNIAHTLTHQSSYFPTIPAWGVFELVCCDCTVCVFFSSPSRLKGRNKNLN